MILRVKKSKLEGSVEAPPSKSYTHRAIIAASLSPDNSKIINALFADDTRRTISACRMFGATIERKNSRLHISGVEKPKTPDDVVNCGESASTIRFLIPVFALTDGIAVLTGGPSLRSRPMDPILDALPRLGAKAYSTRGNGRPPIVVHGKLRGGRTEIRGDVSSQFISGLLFASPLAERDVNIHLTTELESKPYVQMTLQVLEAHGIEVNATADMREFKIEVPQIYRGASHNIVGDFSSSAFLIAAALITGSKVTIRNLADYPTQADRKIIDIAKEMGANIKYDTTNRTLTIYPSALRGVKINAKNSPDLVPVCAVLGCFAEGVTHIYNARRVRIKESDRLHSISSELRKMGAVIKELEDGLIIRGGSKIRGAFVDPHNDHRIAMACAIAGLAADGITVIKNAECISKSYPKFIDDLKKIGAAADVE